MKKAVMAYVPVLHEGYRQFFEKHCGDADLYILGEEIISQFSHLAKEIRQLDPELIKTAIESWGIVQEVKILDQKGLKELQTKFSEKVQVKGKTRTQSTKFSLVMPAEDIMRDLAEKYFSGTFGFL